MPYLSCKVQKLHYCVPRKELKYGLRYFRDDNGIKDIIYHYFHGEEPKAYVEYYSDDKDDRDNENEMSTQIGEVGDRIQANNEVGDESTLDKGQ